MVDGRDSRLIMFIGPCSSVFDYTTYLLMWFVFKSRDLGLAPPSRTRRALRPCQRRQSRFHLRSGTIPDRMVRRVVTHSNLDYPRNTNQ